MVALPEFRALLRLDLKDSGALWSDAELTRCIRMAVDDLSRHLPLEKIYEVTLDVDVTDEGFTTPATASATAIVNAQTLNGKVSGNTLTIADNTPDVPRRLTVKFTDADASVTALTIIVKGYDQNGYYVEESWYLKDLPTTVAVQGKNYFKYVSEVEVDDVAGTQDVADTISVGTGNAYDSFIYLANKPIKPETETVTSSPAGTTYTRDTHYTMDYANGAIKFINVTGMAAGTAYLIDYTKSKLGIDISSILPVVTRIQRVEYPIDQIPQQFATFNIFGDYMYIGSKQTGKSQEEMVDGDHVAIYYERKHVAPGELSIGSYPDFLDELVAIGAGGYALLMEALQYEQQAATDLASARTELGYIGGSDGVSGVHALVVVALNKVTTYLETNDTTDNAKDVLANITDDIANLRNAIVTAMTAVVTDLGYVTSKSLDKVTTGAEAYLDTGDDKINTVNIGDTVAQNYAVYSRTRAEIAQVRVNMVLGYLQEASQRLDNLRTYIEEAGGWNRMADTFLNEGLARISEIDRYLNEAQAYETAATADLTLADRFRAEASIKLAEFHTILKDKGEYRRRTSSASLKQPA
mgnify:CR=1 FL=1